jgi:hypothetical protein
VVTADGFRPYEPGESPRVQLSSRGVAGHLGFRPLDPGRLAAAKRHVAEDLLRVHDRRVTHALLATTALAALYRHADGMGRFALWLRGLTGAGKSYVAKLFANFFGDFPVTSGRFATWGSTPNFLQDQGYYFKDAVFLVDDFKPEVTRNDQVVRLVQAYADNAARGRLNARSVANPTREIRGILVCTAEDLPEHSASVLARTVTVAVPQAGRDIARGRRCAEMAPTYSGVMADFVRFVLQEGWTARFAAEARAAQTRLLGGRPPRQNDARVAANLALMGTAVRAACDYLSDVWPEGPERASEFEEADLTALREESLAGTRQNQTSEVFLRALAGLIEQGQLKVLGWQPHQEIPPGVPVVGRTLVVGSSMVFRLNTSLCLATVNSSLAAQRRPVVAASERALLDQLRADGRLFTGGATPTAGRRGPATHQMSLSIGNRRGFEIASTDLLRDE